MAVYKVIQDIESEDKLLGPLSLKGFIYAAIAGLCAFINFRLILIASPIKWLLILAFAVPMILFGVLASPLGREQPTEVWLLSRIRFFFKPRKRIWDQEGISQQVIITAPKKQERQLTKDLSPTEVQSRLKTLATTLDTRGWAIKNVDVNLSDPDVDAKIVTPDSDRLVGSVGMPHQMLVVDVHAADDILDEKHNPTAQKVDSMMQKAEADRKHGLLSKLKDLVDVEDIPRPKLHTKKQIEKTKKDVELDKKLAKLRTEFKPAGQKEPDSHHKLLSTKPVGPSQPQKPADSAKNPTVTAASQTVNMELAQSGSAFSVATLSSLANRQPKIEQTGPNEVTISLH